jgi:putative (di)nucleoside polyphosphate hydrolase
MTGEIARSGTGGAPRPPAGHRGWGGGEPRPVRRAAGAIVLQGEACLLVRKVKVTSHPGGPRPVAPTWVFPMGGIAGEETAIQAALRELREETGSDQFRVVHLFDEPIGFDLDPASTAAGYVWQETTMVLMELLGDPGALAPRDEEIDAARFFPIDRIPAILTHRESRDFFSRVVLPARMSPTLEDIDHRLPSRRQSVRQRAKAAHQ